MMKQNALVLLLLSIFAFSCSENSVSENQLLDSNLESKDQLIEKLRNAKPEDFNIEYVYADDKVVDELMDDLKGKTTEIPTGDRTTADVQLTNQRYFYRDQVAINTSNRLANAEQSMIYSFEGTTAHESIERDGNSVLIGAGLRTLINSLTGTYIWSKDINASQLDPQVYGHCSIEGGGSYASYPPQAAGARNNVGSVSVLVGFGARNVDGKVTTLWLYYADYDASSKQLLIQEVADIKLTIVSIDKFGTASSVLPESEIRTWDINDIKSPELRRTVLQGIGGRSKNGNFTRAAFKTAYMSY